MLKREKALKIVLDNVSIGGAEFVPTPAAAGRCLASEVFSPLDVPLFDNSAMDGYAVRANDLARAAKKNPIRLKIVEEIPAGRRPRQQVKSGEAALIMTGAMMPAGADAVVVVEETRKFAGYVEVSSGVAKGENIRIKGEVIGQGRVLLQKNTYLRPQEIALLATVNIDRVRVFKKPTVAVISTGSEIVPLGRALKPGQIVDSNRYGVIAQLSDAGARVLDLGIAKDTEKAIESKIKAGIRKADVLLTIGGVSVGEWDLVKKIVARLGKIIFWKINQKPGGPTTFGKIAGKLWFGLPGNPVASLVAFDQAVRPALNKMAGRSELIRPVFNAILEKDYHSRAGKVRLERVVVTYRSGQYFARPVRSLGSGDMLSLTAANGIMVIEELVTHLKAGSTVKIQFF